MSDVDAVFFEDCRDRYFARAAAGDTPSVFAAELGEGMGDCSSPSVARCLSLQRSAVRRGRSGLRAPRARHCSIVFLGRALETMLSDVHLATVHVGACGAVWVLVGPPN